MSETQTISQQASVAPTEGTLRRSIQMKMFASKALHARLALANAENKPEADQQVTLGQIIGNIFDVKEKVGQLPDGTSKTSLMAVGDFEAVNYETGEVFTSTAAYLPAYYLETVKSIIDKGGSASVIFALEIVLKATGKAIPTAYEVRNLIRRRPTDPLNQLKDELAAASRLRLPPPASPVAGLIEGEVVAIEPEPDLPEPDDDDAADVGANANVGDGEGKPRRKAG